MSDRLTRLCAERDRLTARLESGDVSDGLLPQMVGVLTKVLEQIEACEKAAPQTKGTALDEVAARRSTKGATRAASKRV